VAYTTELSQIDSATLRRLSWYRGKPMTKSLSVLIELIALKMAEMKPDEVCSKCRDKTICEACPFNSHPTKRQFHRLYFTHYQKEISN
jgi:hypothetical protein